MKIPFNEDRLALQSKPQIPGRSKDPRKIPLFSSDSEKAEKAEKADKAKKVDQAHRPQATSQKLREEPDIRNPEGRDRGREGGETEPDDRMGTGELGAIQERFGNRVRGIIQEITSAGRGLENPTVEVAVFYQEKVGEIQQELNTMVGETNQIAGEQVGAEWATHANTLNAQLGQLNAQSDQLQGDPPAMEGLEDYMRGILNFFNAIAGMVSTMMIIYGGFQFLTASGDVDKTDQAKRIIQSALIGLITMLIAWSIVNFIRGPIERPFIRFPEDCT